MRLRSPLVVGLSLLLVLPVASCSRKLTKEQCDHLLGRGIGLAAYSGSAEVPVDVEALRKRARREAKAAIASFDQACLGASDNGEINCMRRAKDSAEFIACGDITKKAREAGEIAQLVIAKRHNADECSKYAEHGVHIGVGTADDAGKLHRECDEPMEVGVYKCRLVAADKPAWDACDAP
jgi:hypothetical protein